jgi:hypothetical protein
MKKTLWRLAAAGSGALVALAMSASTAGATSSHEASRWPAPTPSALQLGHQEAQTTQQAGSQAKSTQLAPINLNVPIQLLSLGSNGGKTVQSNSSKAESAAENWAKTVQVVDQDQVVRGDSGSHPSYPSHPSRPSSDEHSGNKHDGQQYPGKQHEPDHRGCEHGPQWKHHERPTGHPGQHAEKGPRHETSAIQNGEQHAATNQEAQSKARSTQVLPVNANVPVQVLGIGWNGGHTEQSNASKAESSAENTAETLQVMGQNQEVEGSGYGHGPSAIQNGEQHAATNQEAQSEATSTQVLPVNANIPVQVLSVGSNGGNTEQANSSKAESSAENTAETLQVLGQNQEVAGSGHGSGSAIQNGEQQAATNQEAQSEATSTQVLPVNVNVPVQVLSVGSNGGNTAQSNSSSAGSHAGNSAGTFQGLAQSQLVGLG